MPLQTTTKSVPFHFTINISVKARELNCSTIITKDEITVQCLSSRMYPNGDCVFDTDLIIGKYNTSNSTINEATKMNVNHSMKNCSLSIPVTNSTDGLITVNVTVYPNVTGHANDSKIYGTKKSTFLNLEKPSVSIQNCPETVQEGINITCCCERADSSQVDVDIYWYKNTPQNIVSNGSISFIGNRNMKEMHYCQSKDIFGRTSNPVLYQPNITFPQIIKHFSVKEDVNKTIFIKRFTNMTLFCEADKEDNQFIQIIKDGKILASAFNNTIEWRIPSTSCDDTGVYQCSVSRYREWTHDSLTVNVCEMPHPAGSDDKHVDIIIRVSIVEAVLLVMSWIVVALLCVKLRRYTNAKGNMSANENVELKQIRENDDGYLIPIDLTNINIGEHVRGDYDSLEPYHGYETISGVVS
ncbi:unnamed protein product [Lymnaea stagnalis]|uniref:Ig-like domain-containing protein n=1 Tax=Lymnaea stagnalis TaxID=6523 RepID=A0AAV2HTA7_LYMST